MSRFAKENLERFRSILEKGLHLSLALAFPLTISGAIYAASIVNILYGAEYTAAAVPFRILALTFPLVFPSALIGNAIFAFDAQRSFIIYTILGIFGNAFLNLLLIPPFGIEGAAWSTFLNNIIIYIYAWQKLRKIVPFSIISRIQKTLLGSAFMALAALLFNLLGASDIPSGILAGIVYLLAIFILKDPLSIEIRAIFR
jgi:O-antigen/teichoic acid export membrane protein